MITNLFYLTQFHDPVSIEDQGIEMLKKIVNSIVIKKKTKQQLAFTGKNQLIPGSVHLGSGYKAITLRISKFKVKKNRYF